MFLKLFGPAGGRGCLLLGWGSGLKGVFVTRVLLGPTWGSLLEWGLIIGNRAVGKEGGTTEEKVFHQLSQIIITVSFHN